MSSNTQKLTQTETQYLDVDFTPPTAVQLDAIEEQARELRAQALVYGVNATGAWIKGLFYGSIGAKGKHA